MRRRSTRTALHAIGVRLRPIASQFLRFGLVGLLAALTYTGVFWLVLRGVGLHHVPANVAAFLVSFEVSHLAHRRWSFGRSRGRERGTRWRFFLVKLVGLGLNTAWGWLAFDVTGLGMALFVPLQLGVTPPSVFALSRVWVFRAA